MSAQVQLLRARPCVPSLTPPVQPVPWGAGPSSGPQITLSPTAPASGHATAGFAFMVVGGTSQIGAVYMRDPGTGLWGLLPIQGAYAPLTWLQPVAILCNAAELFFVTDAPPLGGQPVIVLVAELGS